MQPSRSLSHIQASEFVAWGLFCFTCAYLSFLYPYPILIPGERTNIFAGLICGVSLGAALFVAATRHIRGTRFEIIISLALVFISLLSVTMSLEPLSSAVRVFVLLTSGLGGFWGARILLHSEFRIKTFMWLCTVCFVGLIVYSLRNVVQTGQADHTLHSNPHATVHMIVLLSVGPLSFLFHRLRAIKILGIFLFALGYIGLYFCGLGIGVRSALLLPLAMVLIAILFLGQGGGERREREEKRQPRRRGVINSAIEPVMLVAVLLVAAITAHYLSYMSPKSVVPFHPLRWESYRLESYPFSWHIVKQHPLFGIGLRTPRTQFLTDYRVGDTSFDRKSFTIDVNHIVTSENIFLTLMVGLGLPFVVLYCFALVILLLRLASSLLRAIPTTLIHPVVLCVLLVAAILHGLTTDVLLYPQINWFFHILLGLIPSRMEESESQHVLDGKTIGLRALTVIIGVILGVLVGTHQIFNPVQWSHLKSLIGKGSTDQMNNLSPAHSKKQTPMDATAPHDNRKKSPSEGGLIIQIKEYQEKIIPWHVLVILDNSRSMTEREDVWDKGRLEEGKRFIDRLTGMMDPSQRLAVRSFPSGIAGRIGDQPVPLRVSYMVRLWGREDYEAGGWEKLVNDLRGENNLCAALKTALHRDLLMVNQEWFRILIVTDDMSRCSGANPFDVVEKFKQQGKKPPIDILALGLERSKEAEYRKLSESTGGLFMPVRTPSEGELAVETYARLLKVRQFDPIDVIGNGHTFKVMPHQEVRIPPGLYKVVLPEMTDPALMARELPQFIRIRDNETLTLVISIRDGIPTIQ